MIKIQVQHPFTVRREGCAELLAFTVGVHEVDADVLKHWFVQACITDGRAVLLGTAPPAQQPGPPLTEEQLRAMNNRELIKLAQARELIVPERASKDQLVELLLNAQTAEDMQD